MLWNSASERVVEPLYCLPASHFAMFAARTCILYTQAMRIASMDADDESQKLFQQEASQVLL